MQKPIPALPMPSKYAAARMQPAIGDVVIYSSQAYLVASVLDMSVPLYPDWPTGLHMVLRRSNWAKTLFLIVPASFVEQPVELAA